ncbi:hypothetical protein H0H93_002462 [Arthromyces matolae]|nr:hypothetical protein H0H93_002462 [Arthromyces matolae]
MHKSGITVKNNSCERDPSQKALFMLKTYKEGTTLKSIPYRRYAKLTESATAELQQDPKNETAKEDEKVCLISYFCQNGTYRNLQIIKIDVDDVKGVGYTTDKTKTARIPLQSDPSSASPVATVSSTMDRVAMDQLIPSRAAFLKFLPRTTNPSLRWSRDRLPCKSCDDIGSPCILPSPQQKGHATGSNDKLPIPGCLGCTRNRHSTCPIKHQWMAHEIMREHPDWSRVWVEEKLTAGWAAKPRGMPGPANTRGRQEKSAGKRRHVESDDEIGTVEGRDGGDSSSDDEIIILESREREAQAASVTVPSKRLKINETQDVARSHSNTKPSQSAASPHNGSPEGNSRLYSVFAPKNLQHRPRPVPLPKAPLQPMTHSHAIAGPSRGQVVSPPPEEPPEETAPTREQVLRAYLANARVQTLTYARQLSDDSRDMALIGTMLGSLRDTLNFPDRESKRLFESAMNMANRGSLATQGLLTEFQSDHSIKAVSVRKVPEDEEMLEAMALDATAAAAATMTYRLAGSRTPRSRFVPPLTWDKRNDHKLACLGSLSAWEGSRILSSSILDQYRSLQFRRIGPPPQPVTKSRLSTGPKSLKSNSLYENGLYDEEIKPKKIRPLGVKLNPSRSDDEDKYKIKIELSMVKEEEKDIKIEVKEERFEIEDTKFASQLEGEVDFTTPIPTFGTFKREENELAVVPLVDQDQVKYSRACVYSQHLNQALGFMSVQVIRLESLRKELRDRDIELSPTSKLFLDNTIEGSRRLVLHLSSVLYLGSCEYMEQMFAGGSIPDEQSLIDGMDVDGFDVKWERRIDGKVLKYEEIAKKINCRARVGGIDQSREVADLSRAKKGKKQPKGNKAAKQKGGSKKGRGKAAATRSRSGQKRKRELEEADEESEDENEEEESYEQEDEEEEEAFYPVYRPRGTRSRPIVVG